MYTTRQVDMSFRYRSDEGPYYIREGGTLHGTPGLLPPSPEPSGKRPCLRPVPCSLTLGDQDTPGDQSTPRHHPAPLRTICVRFIALHIDLADSLVGFPEIIGEEIYRAVREGGRMDNPDLICANLLSLFSDAYGDLMLSELGCFRNNHLRLENSLSCLLVFDYLHKLDLFGCHLGDNHDVIEWISKNQSLTHIGLGDNCLSKEGLRRLTSPIRMFKERGPRDISVIDLSYNPLLGIKGLGFLKCLTRLSNLDLSGCDIKDEDIRRLEQMLDVTLSAGKNPCLSPLCGTKGWASDVVNLWATRPVKQRSKPQSTTTKFYSTERKRIAFAQSAKSKVREYNAKCLQFIKTSPVSKEKPRRAPSSIGISNQSDTTKENRTNADMPDCKTCTPTIPVVMDTNLRHILAGYAKTNIKRPNNSGSSLSDCINW